MAALVGLLDPPGIDVQPNEWPGGAPTFDSLGEACAAGIQTAIENADLHDGLLEMVENADAIRVVAACSRPPLQSACPRLGDVPLVGTWQPDEPGMKRNQEPYRCWCRAFDRSSQLRYSRRKSTDKEWGTWPEKRSWS